MESVELNKVVSHVFDWECMGVDTELLNSFTQPSLPPKILYISTPSGSNIIKEIMNAQSKAKGSRAELAVRDILRKYTGYAWERTPLSGALDAVHGLSGDVYIPREKNKYTVEIKHYKDCHINHLLLSGETHQIFTWWSQTIREAMENRNSPLLIFKHDRSKLYVAKEEFTINEDINKLIIDRKDRYLEIALLEEWLQTKPEFVL